MNYIKTYLSEVLGMILVYMCDNCGAMVLDQEVHDKFHGSLQQINEGYETYRVDL